MLLFFTDVKLSFPDMSEKEGIDLLEKCLNESKKRFIVNLASFEVCLSLFSEDLRIDGNYMFNFTVLN